MDFPIPRHSLPLRLACALALAGCTAAGEPSLATGALGAGAQGELVITDVLWAAPEGADGRTRYAIAWRDAHGAATPIDLPAPAVDARTAREGAFALLADGELVRIGLDGSVAVIASDAIGEIAVSEDGAALAYVQEEGDLGALHVVDAGGDVVVARELQSAGLFRFAPDGSAIVFVGARRGGVAGLMIAARDGSESSALTNGNLRAGRPWADAFVPPPGDADAITFEGDVVRWTTVDGATFERAWRLP